MLKLKEETQRQLQKMQKDMDDQRAQLQSQINQLDKANKALNEQVQ